MKKIQHLYMENTISRNQGQVQQHLTFFMQVENVGYDKQVDIVWAGEDGLWQTLAASYHSAASNNQEYWQAQISLTLSEQNSLPGNIQFGLRYRIAGNEYWDSNVGLNHSSEADSGILLAQGQLVQNINFASHLEDDQHITPVTIAIDQSVNIKEVTIHWTTDNWQTIHKTACHSTPNYWDNKYQSNARNPNQYGNHIWTAEIEHGDSYRLEYSLCCESDERLIWNNNSGNNFCLQRPHLKVLILNLHCYQEENQDEKFTTIAQAINERDIDIVCLQEVAEYWRDGEGDWESNSAKIINDRLTKPFHLHTDWSHLGFNKYREGVAILSRFPMTNLDARYVSESNDIYDIHARKVVKAQIQVPCIGAINVFSAHLSWLEDGFEQQFKQLHSWANDSIGEEINATLLCGDFNITAGTTGYELVVQSDHYDDQFLAANEPGAFEKIFKVNDPHWKNLLADDYRIDYIFMNKKSGLMVNNANVLFTDQDYGRVSDHCGYLMTFEPKIAKEDKHAIS